MFHIAEGDVGHRNKRLSLASSIRIKHAAITVAIRLLLLLWADVDAPPDRFVDLNVVIDYVRDFST